MTRREKIYQAFVKYGPRLTTREVCKLTGLYTTAVRNYLREGDYRKVGTETGKLNTMSTWELVKNV